MSVTQSAGEPRNAQLPMPRVADDVAEWECPTCQALLVYEVAGTPGSRYHGHTQQVAARALQLDIDEHLQAHTEVQT